MDSECDGGGLFESTRKSAEQPYGGWESYVKDVIVTACQCGRHIHARS
jgi:hypothetical protein